MVAALAEASGGDAGDVMGVNTLKKSNDTNSHPVRHRRTRSNCRVKALIQAYHEETTS
jgi:hypothetical protein